MFNLPLMNNVGKLFLNMFSKFRKRRSLDGIHSRGDKRQAQVIGLEGEGKKQRVWQEQKSDPREAPRHFAWSPEPRRN
jgi:hypothetical protein